jgi:hypothetical protein
MTTRMVKDTQLNPQIRGLRMQAYIGPPRVRAQIRNTAELPAGVAKSGDCGPASLALLPTHIVLLISYS